MDSPEDDIVNKTTDGKDTILSDWEAFQFKLILFVFGCGIVSIIGILTNTINIIVFVKQGAYKEHGSVNLLGLAITDLFLVSNTLLNSVLYGITLMDPPNLSWVPFDVMYITSAWPHLMFAQITRAVTAYIAFERCICVVFPFKVKTIFTPNRSIIVIACIFISFLLSYSPVFIKQQLKHTTDPLTNISKLRLVSSQDWLFVVDVMWAVNSILINQGSVAVVLICTVITVSRVRLSKTWRESMSGGRNTTSSTSKPGSSNQEISNSKLQKEKRLITMITLISFIFLACYIPDLTFMLMYAANRDIRIAGKYDNLAWTVYGFVFLMEAVNSSINILVYYRMSSRYKQVFKEIMGLDAGKRIS